MLTLLLWIPFHEPAAVYAFALLADHHQSSWVQLSEGVTVDHPASCTRDHAHSSNGLDQRAPSSERSLSLQLSLGRHDRVLHLAQQYRSRGPACSVVRWDFLCSCRHISSDWSRAIMGSGHRGRTNQAGRGKCIPDLHRKLRCGHRDAVVAHER